jgi:hypothetical protein
MGGAVSAPHITGEKERDNMKPNYISRQEQANELFTMAAFEFEAVAEKMLEGAFTPGLIVRALVITAAGILDSCPDQKTKEELRQSVIAMLQE